MPKPTVLAFAGSLRTGSFNRKLVGIASEHVERAGADVTRLHLRDFPLPVYDGDIESESGLPENAKKLKSLFADHDALLISCPEYNSSITPLLKNTIDWVSRREPDEPPLIGFRGKIAALLSASPGRLGGLRGLVHVRAILGNLGVLVLPEQVAVPNARQAFDAHDALADPDTDGRVIALTKKLVHTVERLRESA